MGKEIRWKDIEKHSPKMAARIREMNPQIFEPGGELLGSFDEMFPEVFDEQQGDSLSKEVIVEEREKAQIWAKELLDGPTPKGQPDMIDLSAMGSEDWERFKELIQMRMEFENGRPWYLRFWMKRVILAVTLVTVVMGMFFLMLWSNAGLL